MTTDFGSPALHTSPSGEDRHVDLGSKPSPPPAGNNTERRVCLRAWLDTTAWWTEPRPAIAALIADAREGEWTLKQWQRTCKVGWLQIAARLGRLLPHFAARAVVEEPPRLWGELPTVRDVADDPELARWPDAAYRVANWLSWVADSGMRTGVFIVAALWLPANYFNNVPVINHIVPDEVTAAYWWPGLLHLMRLLLPALAGLGFLAVVVALFVWRSKRKWRLQREAATRQLQLDDDNDEEER